MGRRASDISWRVAKVGQLHGTGFRGFKTPQLTLAIVPEVSPRPTAFLTDSTTVIFGNMKGCRGGGVEGIGLGRRGTVDLDLSLCSCAPDGHVTQSYKDHVRRTYEV